MSAVNLAALVADGEMIYIPAYGEDISVIEEQTEGIVNINKATESELMTLPGIGSSRAADIVRITAATQFLLILFSLIIVISPFI
jgi:competence protein ComEA